MHEEHKAAVLVAAFSGERVAVFADTLDESTVILDELADWLKFNGEGVGYKVRRLNGSQAIEFDNGGRVSFHSMRQSPRGRSFDRIYLPICSAAVKVRELSPCLLTSRVGVLVGY